VILWPFSCSDFATSSISTLSLHDALPILLAVERLEHDDVVETVEELGLEGGAHHLHHPIVLLLLGERLVLQRDGGEVRGEDEDRSEEHTSELQSRFELVCRLLLEKKKMQI